MSKPTVDEMRDYVAGCLDGGKWKKVRTPHGIEAWRHESLMDDPCSNWGHPLPYTIDAIAGALPPGYLWDSIYFFKPNDIWQAWAREKIGVEREMATATTEKEARLRAVYAAWRRVGGHT